MKIKSVIITPMPRPMPLGMFDPMPEVIANFGAGSTCTVDESCDLVVETFDFAGGDAVFEKCGDCRNVPKQSAREAAQWLYPRFLDQTAPTLMRISAERALIAAA